jgi:hypothetical protein
VVADAIGRSWKAKERQAICELVLSHRGRRLRHVSKSTFINLRGPWVSPHEVGSRGAEAPRWKPKEFRLRHSSDEPSNDRGAKGVAERGSEE